MGSQENFFVIFFLKFFACFFTKEDKKFTKYNLIQVKNNYLPFILFKHFKAHKCEYVGKKQVHSIIC